MITKEQKSSLAKLLATENITVQHRNVETAYFVPKQRLLCLPIWEDMSNDLYDMLVGHEVGHALYTPIEDVQKLKENKIPHSYYNVVEDIRIDKKMKLKYPGLRKSYFNGYNELLERNFFMLEDRDINGMRFIDRLNVYTKSGYTMNDIEFNDIEQGFVKRSESLDTWQDVEKLVQDIFAYSGTEEFDEDQYEETEVNLTVRGDGEQQESDEETTPEDGTDPVQGQEDDDGDENEGNGPEGGEVQNEAITDKAFDEQKKANFKPQDNEYTDNQYVTLPKRKTSTVTNKEVIALFDEGNSERRGEYYQKFQSFKRKQLRTVNYMIKEFEMKKSADDYKRTKTSKTGMLNMSKLHQYKYNDDIFKRINITPGAKNHGMILVVDWSGSMDSCMYDTLVQTANLVMFCKAVQIPCKVYAFSDVNKRHFKLNSEDSYTYGERYTNTPYTYENENELIMENVTMIELVDTTVKTPQYNASMAYFHKIIDYFSHRGSGRYYHYDDDRDYKFRMPNCMRLGGTPLDSAILQSIDLVNNFQKEYKVQKMTTIFLTDGCGHVKGAFTKERDQSKEHNPYDGDVSNKYNADYSNGQLVIQDGNYQFKYNDRHATRSVFKAAHEGMFNYFKHKTNSQLIGFYITHGKNVSFSDVSNHTSTKNEYLGYERYEEYKKELRANGCISIKNVGYDELYILPKSKLQVKDEEVNITNDMTTAKMKQQFLKNFKSKKVSRVLLNKFISKVA